MNIKIVHLYYDLMNENGENGNIRALVKFLKKQNIESSVYFFTINDNFNFDDYDIFYLGNGTEYNKYIVLKDLINKKYKLKEAIENYKYFFFTGNSYELLGKHIIDINNQIIKTLNIFQYYSKVVDFNDNNFSIKHNFIGKCSFINEYIIGFQNKTSIIYNNTSPLFNLINNNDFEGYKYKNCYATHLLGPLFIRNPYFTNYLVKKIVHEKYPNYKFKLIHNDLEVKSYKNIINNI